MMRRRRSLIAVGVMILCAGCRTVPKVGGGQALPPAPPDTTQFSDYEPDHPYEPWGEGVASRLMYTTPSDEGYDVEVRDVLVSPRKPDALVPLEGAAVLEVRQGIGDARVGEEWIKLRSGTIFTLDAGKSLRITAYDEPLGLRTWIFSEGKR